jgi:hypothetical protein
MEVSKDVKLYLLNRDLELNLNEEYLIKTRLAIAIEVENKQAIPNLESAALLIVRTIDSLKKRVAELENS